MPPNERMAWRTILFLIAASLPCYAQDSVSPATPTAIARWIEQLDHDSFSVREAATNRLINTGAAAADAVTAAARGNKLEVTERALRILDEWAFSPDPAAARAAKRTLIELANSEFKSAARARNVLRFRQERIVTSLENRGASVSNVDDRIVAVFFKDTEEFRGGLPLLRELPDLERVSLSFPRMDDDAAVELKGLSRVTDLNLFQSRISDMGLEHLKTLPKLRSVPMGQTQVTDRGLVHLKGMQQLEYIGLRGNRITDAGLVHLKDLTNLTGLHLGETKVTDAGLVQLRGLAKLNLLRLDHTVVSDAGLEHLHGLTELRDLDLSETQVTDEGVAELQKALPVLEVTRGQP